MKSRLKDELKNNLLGNVDHVEYRGGGTKSSGVNAGLLNVTGNPDFVSQFDLNVTLKYRDLGISFDPQLDATYLVVTTDDGNVEPADLPSQLKNQLPAFLFGNSDFASGFKNANNNLPVQNWVSLEPIIVKSRNQVIDFPVITNQSTPYNGEVVSPSVSDGVAEIGDLILPFIYQPSQVAPGGGVQYKLAEVIVNCKQVGYGTLLDSISSDRFVINNIRYKVPDLTKTAQFEKQLWLITQSLFGKLATDKVSPAAFQDPRQFQDGIIDIPIEKGIDKQSLIATYLNYDVGEILLSMYVKSQDKLEQSVI